MKVGELSIDQKEKLNALMDLRNQLQKELDDLTKPKYGVFCFMWSGSKKSFERVFNRLKEIIEVNGKPAEGMVPIFTESEDTKLEDYGVVETSRINLWLLPETEIEVGDTVKLRGSLYRVVEVKSYLTIAKKVVLEKTEA